MPKSNRKSKVPFAPQVEVDHTPIPEQVLNLAAEYEIDPQALLDWKVYPSGKVVLIAPNGMKLVYEKNDGGEHGGRSDVSDHTPACAAG